MQVYNEGLVSLNACEKSLQEYQRSGLPRLRMAAQQSPTFQKRSFW
jgi:hypothetical protein